MMKTYKTTSRRVPATPRSERLRAHRVVTVGSASTSDPATAIDNRLGSLLRNLDNLLVPINADGEELSLLAADDAIALKAKVSLFSMDELAAKGVPGGSGDDEPGGAGGVDEDMLAELLREWGYATEAWVGEQGFATVEWVNGRGFLRESQANLLYQPRGNYLTAQSLADYYTKTESDGKYALASALNSCVKKSGDTMTGVLTIQTGADAKLIFNNTDGEKYTKISFREAGTEYGSIISNSEGLFSAQRVKAPYFESSDAALCPNLNADLLDGKHLSDILSSNVASASKLATARTLWGQSFNGEGDVSGSLIDVLNVQMSGNLLLKKTNAELGYY
ncbi:MAG: hypothetical protein K2J06_07340, partial [Muribaculaceae bacterium]|nr:hypothetical protein [Muribaculaceae bacterium]